MGSEPLFPLHHRWEVMPLGEVCRRGGGNVQTGPFGSQLHASDYVSDGIPSVMPQNIGDNKILYTGIAKITREDAERLSKYRMREGDIVYSRRGDVERRALVRKTEDGWLCGTGCLRIRFGDEVVYPRYAAHYLGHPSVREWIVRHAHGATMPNLNTTILSELPFVLPPWSAQVLIGDAIEAYDRKLDLNRRINQTLEAMAQAIFQSWFVNFDPVKAKVAAIQEGRDPLRAAMTAVSGKADAELDALPPEQYEQLAATAVLFPDEMEESEYGEIPKGWGFRSVADVAEFGRGKVDVSILNEDTYISTENMLENRGGVSRATSLPSVATVPSFKTGQILVSNIRPYFKKIWMAHFDGGRSPDVLAFEPIVAQSTEFLYNLMYQDAFFEFMTRTAKGAKMPRGDKDAIMGWRFPCPDEALMVYFSEKVRPYYEYINSLKSENDSLAELRDTLLPKLLSGELSVTDAMVEAEA